MAVFTIYFIEKVSPPKLLSGRVSAKIKAAMTKNGMPGGEGAMNIQLEQNLAVSDVEVLIRYARMNRTVERLATLIQSFDKTIRCSQESTEVWLNASDIYYIESVDKRTFVYGEKSVYRSDMRLYQLLSELADIGFVQVSKSCILNIHVLENVRPLMNSRMEATLSNGEKINMTRKYIPAVKGKLTGR